MHGIYQRGGHLPDHLPTQRAAVELQQPVQILVRETALKNRHHGIEILS
jgi:hypothetical protein